MAKQMNPQGYNYGKDPTNTNPFWSESEIAEKLTASASVDNTTGTPEVSVATTGYNVDFKFSGLKGERGEKGEQGIQGERGERGEQGEQGRPGISGVNGTNGHNVTINPTGSKESGTIATVVSGYTMVDGEYKYTTSYIYNGDKGERGAKGEKGDTGAAGKDGKDADISECVTNVSVTNENGVFGIKQTKGTGTGAVESDVGSLEVPDTSNLVAEVTDSVVEDDTNGFDYHTIKETENNGTQNNVGSFYIARNQITKINEDGQFETVDQFGTRYPYNYIKPNIKSVGIGQTQLKIDSTLANNTIYLLILQGVTFTDTDNVDHSSGLFNVGLIMNTNAFIPIVSSVDINNYPTAYFIASPNCFISDGIFYLSGTLINISENLRLKEASIFLQKVGEFKS